MQMVGYIMTINALYINSNLKRNIHYNQRNHNSCNWIVASSQIRYERSSMLMKHSMWLYTINCRITWHDNNVYSNKWIQQIQIDKQTNENTYIIVASNNKRKYRITCGGRNIIDRYVRSLECCCYRPMRHHGLNWHDIDKIHMYSAPCSSTYFIQSNCID